mmetsp:Transcript_29245/g.84010  ORF Transcript_29245/g.84010 Transcript_29245/m.84010 type:complete len:1151 (-) Transcript_29245:22-3474(-)
MDQRDGCRTSARARRLDIKGGRSPVTRLRLTVSRRGGAIPLRLVGLGLDLLRRHLGRQLIVGSPAASPSAPAGGLPDGAGPAAERGEQGLAVDVDGFLLRPLGSRPVAARRSRGRTGPGALFAATFALLTLALPLGRALAVRVVTVGSRLALALAALAGAGLPFALPLALSLGIALAFALAFALGARLPLAAGLLGVAGLLKHFLHHLQRRLDGFGRAAHHHPLLVALGLHLEIFDARRMADRLHRHTLLADHDAALLPLDVDKLRHHGTRKRDRRLQLRPRLLHRLLLAHDLDLLRLPIHDDRDVELPLDVAKLARTLQCECFRCRWQDALNRLRVAERVMRLLNLGLRLVLVLLATRHLEDRVLAALATADELHPRTRRLLEGLAALLAPQARLLVVHLDGQRCDRRLLHALLQHHLPLVDVCLLTQQEHALRLPHHGQPRCLTQFAELRRRSLAAPLALAGTLRCRPCAVIQARDHIRGGLHQASGEILHEAVDGCASLLNLLLVASDTDRCNGLVVVSVLLPASEVHLDQGASVRLQLLHVLSVGANHGASLVVVHADERRRRGGLCRALATARAAGACRGFLAGILMDQVLLQLLMASLHLLRRAIDCHLALVAVDEDALEVLLELASVRLLRAHDCGGLLRGHVHHLALGEVQGAKCGDTCGGLPADAVHHEAPRRPQVLPGALAHALGAVRAVDDDAVLLLEAALVQKAHRCHILRQVHHRAHDAPFIDLFRLDPLAGRDAAGQSFLVVVGPDRFLLGVVGGNAFLHLLAQLVHVLLELQVRLPAVRLRQLLALPREHFLLGIGRERQLVRLALSELLHLLEDLRRVRLLRAGALRVAECGVELLHDLFEAAALLHDLLQHLRRRAELGDGLDFLDDDAHQILVVAVVLRAHALALLLLLVRDAAAGRRPRLRHLLDFQGAHLLSLLAAARLLHGLHPIVSGRGRLGRRRRRRCCLRLRLGFTLRLGSRHRRRTRLGRRRRRRPVGLSLCLRLGLRLRRRRRRRRRRLAAARRRGRSLRLRLAFGRRLRCGLRSSAFFLRGILRRRRWRRCRWRHRGLLRRLGLGRGVGCGLLLRRDGLGHRALRLSRRRRSHAWDGVGVLPSAHHREGGLWSAPFLRLLCGRTSRGRRATTRLCAPSCATQP